MKAKLLFGALMLTAATANAQLATINENFDAFSATPLTSSIPQNGWNKVIANVPHNVYVAANNGTNAVQFYAGGVANNVAYLISPQIVAPNGTKKVQFTTAISVGTNGGGTIQAGLSSSTTNMTTFQALGDPINLAITSTTPQTITLDVPASSLQYIVFKFTGLSDHAAAYVDNVKYDTASVLAVADYTKSSENIKFAVNADNTSLQFAGKTQPKNVEIYSAAGQNVASGKVNNNQFDISTLQAGVYYILIETTEGKAVKSKFIKK